MHFEKRSNVPGNKKNANEKYRPIPLLPYLIGRRPDV